MEEIEELEDRIRKLERKLDLLETQLRTYDEDSEKKLNEKDREWSGRYRELER